MSYEITEVKEMRIAGKKVRAANNNPESMAQIGNLWYEFADFGPKIHGTMDAERYGVYFDFSGDYHNPASLAYDLLAGLEVAPSASIADEFSEVTIMPGKYAKFTTVGNPMVAPAELWQEVWQTELDRVCISDFEMYHFSGDMDKVLIEIYIGIK